MFIWKRASPEPRRNATVADRFGKVGFRPQVEILEDRLAPCWGTGDALTPSIDIAVPDFYSTPVNTPVSGDVKANDPVLFHGGTDYFACVNIVTQPLHGTLQHRSGDGHFAYTPNSGFVGADFFTYMYMKDPPGFYDPLPAFPGTSTLVTITVAGEGNSTPPGITVSPNSGLTTTEAGGTAQFSVALNTQPTADVTVSLASNDTTEGTISAGSLTFTPQNWNQAQTATVTGVDDTVYDGDVAYTIVTSPASSSDAGYDGLNAADVSATNQENDSPPSITISDVSKKEGNSGTTAFVFTVTLSHASYQTITVNYATSDGTAKAGTDYTAASGTLTFAPNDASEEITVWVNGDTVKESNEAFYVNLSNASNASIADAQAVATILNDDKRN